ncbi:MFS transporter [Nocardioides sp. BP30]|uniref:MFS transporter n=1 Tax=Nocardioides sp. BP30 TaxID=3036374 RepID=UPI0024692CEB|nr:MFS transporter [Nocardioides sp. BP30]WGL51726.1 MFS transporter [Nocardioides sp. BP30]
MTVSAPTSEAVETRTRGYRLAILALAIGGFAIGTTEFQTMGILPEVADGVGVSVPQAGHVISAYALGVVVGVPILGMFGATLPRKGLLMGLMAAYGVFNLLSAVASSYGLLMLARFLDGLPHGAYFGVASLVAAELADPRHRGRAIARVMLGLSIANVVGVPASTWLGEHGGWRAPYVVSALLAALTAAMIWRFVPRVAPAEGSSARGEASSFFTNKQVWLTMVAGALGFGGLFATYSYIAKTVTTVAHLSNDWTPVFVLGYGLGMVVGTWLAGELVRWSVLRTLVLFSAASIVMMLIFWLVAPVGWLLWPVAFVVALVGSVVATSMQVRLMDVAGDAVTLGAAMMHAALNVANALGAWIGGVVIDAGYSYRAPALAGAGLAVVGVAILMASVSAHRTAVRAALTE